MTLRRIFTADEIARLFKGQANKANEYSIDLGDGVRAVQMAEKSGLTFTLERAWGSKPLRDADAAELKEISEILWAKFEPFLPDDPADDLIPDELKEKPDDPNLEPDPTGLLPDCARQTKADAERERRIADGTATADERLLPDWVREQLKERGE